MKRKNWKNWKKFTGDNLGEKFEILFNNQVTNKGTIQSFIDNGEMAIKGLLGDREEAENLARQINEEFEYRDIAKQQRHLIEEHEKGVQQLIKER